MRLFGLRVISLLLRQILFLRMVKFKPLSNGMRMVKFHVSKKTSED